MPHPYAVGPDPVELPAARDGDPAPGAVLLVTRDRALIEVLERLALAAGAELDVRAEVPTRSAWLDAGLVFVGADLAAPVAESLPRRPGVVLAGLAVGGALEVADDRAIWRAAVDVGAERVAVLPDQQDWVVEALADSLDGARRCAVVGVVGGCGGGGASTLATAIAVRASLERRRVLLADLDPLGGGLDLVLGTEGVPGLRWPDLTQARGRVSGGMLREALPRVDGLSVLSWGGAGPAVPPDAATAVASGAVRGFDLVVADLPRARELVPAGWLRRVDLALLVVPDTARAVAGATRVIDTLAPMGVDLRAVVREAGPGADEGRAVADELGVPLFARLRAEPGLRAALARGEPPGLRRRGPLGRCAALVLEAASRWEQAA